MKLFVVYFRTMEDSPEVHICAVTTDETVAKTAYKKAKKDERHLMKDAEDNESDDWAQAHMKTFVFDEGKLSKEVFVFVETVWHEFVETIVYPFLNEEGAEAQLEFARKKAKKDYPGIRPFDDEPFEESFHLHDDNVMVDVYLGVEKVTLI